MKKHGFFTFLIVLFFAFNVSSKTAIVFTDANGHKGAVILNYDIDCSKFKPAPGVTVHDCWNFLTGGGGGTSPGNGPAAIATPTYSIYVNDDVTGGVVKQDHSTGYVTVLKSTADIITDTDAGLNVHVNIVDGVPVITASTFDPFAPSLRIKSSIVENSNDSELLEFELYPNPSNSITKIKLNNFDVESKYDLLVYSIDGKLVFSNKILNEITTLLKEDFQNENGVFVIKVIKNGRFIENQQKLIIY